MNHRRIRCFGGPSPRGRAAAPRRRALAAAAAASCLLAGAEGARGFTVLVGDPANPVPTVLRWDAAAHPVAALGFEDRSLQGGIEYTVEGGSYEAFRDLFQWSEVPSPEAFQAAVEAAFGAWTVVDPATGLGTELSFSPNLARAPVGPNALYPTTNPFGAEIDLLAREAAFFWGEGSPLLVGQAFPAYDMLTSTVTLTSGVADYPSSAIVGVDVILNNNPEAVWDLESFQLLLTHEIGHALGLADVDVFDLPVFIDDNFDGSTSASALATLTNPFAQLINPLDPTDFSGGLALYHVPDADPGFDTPGVHLLMERCQSGSLSDGSCSIAGPLLGNPFPLSNDEFAGRQYLYPVVPEPGSGWLLAVGVAWVAGKVRGARQA